ncbi:MAG: hypothetical protein IPK13_01470 [Deltaproteobacteria bacterium]|nr:hypothetical protein [Deltaproteobacteria bacterium]
MDALSAKLAQFAPAELTASTGHLSGQDQAALIRIIEAAKLMDPIFDRQAYEENPKIHAELADDKSPLGAAKLAYFEIMRGPWDRQDHHAPFAIDRTRPPGGGFYPIDLTAEAFKAYVKKHSQDKDALESLFTVVKRTEEGRLEAIPYHEAYKTWLEPAASKLIEAANATSNPSLAKFLRSRAEAFRTDDYYQSDKDWMDVDSLVEVTIGPYETYEDQLLGLKASFEAFVTIADPSASAELAKYKALLPKMEANLPIPDEVKTKRGAESPIRVVDLVYSSGDARKSVQTIAFNLPNDERVRKEKGAKKVLLRNSIEKKFDLILRPIANRIIAEDQLEHLSASAFFYQVLFHELSHSLGPAFTSRDGEEVEVRLALGSSYSAIEECKADVMGAYNILYMIELGEMPKDFADKLLHSYFAGLFRSVRFGVAEAHGKGAAVQINRFLSRKGATFEPSSARFTVHPDALRKAMAELLHDLLMLQHAGDKAAADAMLEQEGIMSTPMVAALTKVGDIPVDIRPLYPLADRTAPDPAAPKNSVRP